MGKTTLETEVLHRITVDVESDWGGRSRVCLAIQDKMPWFLSELKSRRLKALFFLSTEHLESWLQEAKAIQAEGHLIGSHGHVHKSWRGRPWYEWRVDYLTSMEVLKKHLGLDRKTVPYRAPKFSYVKENEPYSNPKQHVTLLKTLWFPWKKLENRILVVHPFDLQEIHMERAPNLLLKAWYSRGSQAKSLLLKYLDCIASG